tara:strand:- start:2047 stop:2373 length:327 start_codon:yes stop_codon:yes gene_type:complete
MANRLIPSPGPVVSFCSITGGPTLLPVKPRRLAREKFFNPGKVNAGGGKDRARAGNDPPGKMISRFGLRIRQTGERPFNRIDGDGAAETPGPKAEHLHIFHHIVGLAA